MLFWAPPKKTERVPKRRKTLNCGFLRILCLHLARKSQQKIVDEKICAVDGRNELGYAARVCRLISKRRFPVGLSFPPLRDEKRHFALLQKVVAGHKSCAYSCFIQRVYDSQKNVIWIFCGMKLRVNFGCSRVNGARLHWHKTGRLVGVLQTVSHGDAKDRYHVIGKSRVIQRVNNQICKPHNRRRDKEFRDGPVSENDIHITRRIRWHS